MTTLDTPLASRATAAADGIVIRIARFTWRVLAAIGREIAYTIAEDRAHGRINNHPDGD
jgi:hypothetical protein